MLVAASEPGVCRVVCFSPRHDLSLSQMDPQAVTHVVDAWRDQDRELSALPFVRYVEIFENRGALMGASNPHPHGQIWASASIPNEITKEETRQTAYLKTHGSCLLCDYVSAEKNGTRVVYSNSEFIALVPFWAVWPFETLIVSTRHCASLKAARPDPARTIRRCFATHSAVLRSALPRTVPLHHGTASATGARRAQPRVAFSRALSPTVARTFTTEIHGRLRTARYPTTRCDSRMGRGAIEEKPGRGVRE